MAETLRDMVVSLSLNSDNFSANLRSINQQLKEADSQFKLAASGVTNFENTAAGAQAQLASLQQKFQLQQQAVQQYIKWPMTIATIMTKMSITILWSSTPMMERYSIPAQSAAANIWQPS
ncbi:MAG: hypothetical protein IKE17_01260 [Clostridia bacterium]|nr:hypothetical protein [Clostridia bacterium]